MTSKVCERRIEGLSCDCEQCSADAFETVFAASEPPMTRIKTEDVVEHALALREECRKGVEDRGVMPDYVSACVTLNHLAPKLLDEVERLREENARVKAVEADAVSGLRYIVARYGRLEGVGWDRVFDAHDKLATLTPSVDETDGHQERP